MMVKRFFIILMLFAAFAAAVFYLSGGKTVYEPARSLERINANQNDASQWFRIKKRAKVKGVALVVHGLNLKPERMQPIIAELNDAGIDVLNLSLRGHSNNYLKNSSLSADEARLESFQTVTYGIWMNEIYTAYLQIKDRAAKKKVPVYFIGYSLGGLIGCDLLLRQPDIFYDRMVLFAPALSVTVESYLLKALSPFPNIVIDSLSPLYYRSNKGTPMAAYKALFEAVDDFNRKANEKLNRPTLVFIDEQDEFVPLKRLTDMVSNLKLTRWQIHLVRKDSDVGKDVSKHLIIDRDCVGRQMWKRMNETIKEHLDFRP